MEEFRELPEYPGYKIGNMGTIIGLKGWEMSKCINSDGYNTIRVNGKCMVVHRLVGFAWVPNPESKPFIDHINRVRNDNRACNLRWVTKKENMNNMSMRKDNKTGIVGLSFNDRVNRWVVQITINDIKYSERFKERPEAEIYLQQILGNL